METSNPKYIFCKKHKCYGCRCHEVDMELISKGKDASKDFDHSRAIRVKKREDRWVEDAAVRKNWCSINITGFGDEADDIF